MIVGDFGLRSFLGLTNGRANVAAGAERRAPSSSWSGAITKTMKSGARFNLAKTPSRWRARTPGCFAAASIVRMYLAFSAPTRG